MKFWRQKNGKVGLELFYENSKNLDIVLLDGMLPDIDGVDVLKEIREHSQVSVIMLTARESEEDQLKRIKQWCRSLHNKANF